MFAERHRLGIAIDASVANGESSDGLMGCRCVHGCPESVSSSAPIRDEPSPEDFDARHVGGAYDFMAAQKMTVRKISVLTLIIQMNRLIKMHGCQVLGGKEPMLR
jgi:hypothetical protein